MDSIDNVFSVRRLAAVFTISHIACNRAGEENRLLGYITDSVSQCFLGIFFHIHAVNQHFTFRCIIKSRNQVDNRTLTTAGRTDESHRIALMSCKCNVFQHILLCIRIFEADMTKLYFTGHTRLGFCLRTILNGRFCIQYLIDTLCSNRCTGHQHEDHNQHHESHHNLHRIL